MFLTFVACSDYGLGGASDAKPGGDKPDAEHTGARDSAVDTARTDTGEAKKDPGDSAPDESDGPPPDTAAPDGKVDVVLLIDVAYFYDCYHADLPVTTSALTNRLLDSGADVAIAIATYDDYQVSGEWYAADGGKPYDLKVQLTNDRARLDAVSASLVLGWGGDWQGSGYEALYQAAKGKGYDQDCDGRLDAANDVPPFVAGSSDAFGGGVAGVDDASVPGSGDIAGVGFRGGSKRVLVLFAENGLRSAALGHEVPTGTCPAPASSTNAASGISSVGAKLLGVNSYEFQDVDRTLQNQLEELASATGSLYDADGDGRADDLAVLSGSWDWPETERLVDAIWQLAGS